MIFFIGVLQMEAIFPVFITAPSVSVDTGLKVDFLELQIEGKKKMSVQEFINGYKSYNLSKLI